MYKLPSINFRLQATPSIVPVVLERFTSPQEPKTSLLLQRLSDNMIIDVLMKKGKITTEAVSSYLKEKYNKIVPRNEISKLWLGTLQPSAYVKNTQEYKNAMENGSKRVVAKGKSEAWKLAIVQANSKRDISDNLMSQIMRAKKTEVSADTCSEKFLFDSGKKIGKNIGRSTIQQIWNGKQKPLGEVSEEYQRLLDYVRKRNTKYPTA